MELYFVECSGEADIVFVVDTSGSIRENRFTLVRNYIISVVNEMEVSQDKVRKELHQYTVSNVFVFDFHFVFHFVFGPITDSDSSSYVFFHFQLYQSNYKT